MKGKLGSIRIIPEVPCGKDWGVGPQGSGLGFYVGGDEAKHPDGQPLCLLLGPALQSEHLGSHLKWDSGAENARSPPDAH